VGFLFAPCLWRVARDAATLRAVALAWDWIHAQNRHGEVIRDAEIEMDRIGSKGNPEALQRACNAWVDAWHRAIEDWMRTGGNRQDQHLRGSNTSKSHLLLPQRYHNGNYPATYTATLYNDSVIY